MHELKQAIRRSRRRPGRVAAGAFALALGIGASSAAVSAVRHVLLAPLPVADQDRLVVLWHRSFENALAHVPFGFDQFEAVRAASTSMTGVAAVETIGAWPTPAEAVGAPFVLHRVRVAGDFFGVLGARPAAGRLLDARDDEPGAAPVAVVSHDHWVRAMGADTGAVGSTLCFDGRAYSVVGVAPVGFDFPRGTDAWVTSAARIRTSPRAGPSGSSWTWWAGSPRAGAPRRRPPTLRASSRSSRTSSRIGAASTPWRSRSTNACSAPSSRCSRR